MSKLKYSSGSVAANHDDNPSDVGSLLLMGSPFLGSVQKNLGTEVADDRDSNYYSSEEYSWAPIEKMYGENTFVCQ